MKPILVWDWDGTLVDSIGFKYDTIWEHVFPNDLAEQKSVREFLHTPEGRGLNRYGLIRHALASTTNPEVADLSDEELMAHPLIKKHAAFYAQAAEENAHSAGLFPGVKDTLEELHKQGFHSYIISGGGTDDDLKSMAAHLGIKDYFLDIFGFGKAGMSATRFGKDENFERVRELEQDSSPDDFIIIGDAETDKLFAEKVGARFIGIANKWNGWQPDGKEIIETAAHVSMAF